MMSVMCVNGSTQTDMDITADALGSLIAKTTQ